MGFSAVRKLFFPIITWVCVGCGGPYAGPFGIGLSSRSAPSSSKSNQHKTKDLPAPIPVPVASTSSTSLLKACVTPSTYLPFLHILGSGKNPLELLATEKPKSITRSQEGKEVCYTLDLPRFSQELLHGGDSGGNGVPSCKDGSIIVIDRSKSEKESVVDDNVHLTVSKRKDSSLIEPISFNVADNSMKSDQCEYPKDGTVYVYGYKVKLKRGSPPADVNVQRYVLIFPKNFVFQ